MADALFSEPRLAELYDLLDPDRSDLDAYVALAAEFNAGTASPAGRPGHHDREVAQVF